jgi:hypothetical protein
MQQEKRRGMFGALSARIRVTSAMPPPVLSSTTFRGASCGPNRLCGTRLMKRLAVRSVWN